MKKFNKVLTSKTISLIIACVFMLNTTAYGIDLPKKASLRVPSISSERYLDALSAIIGKDNIPESTLEGYYDDMRQAETLGGIKKFGVIPIDGFSHLSELLDNGTNTRPITEEGRELLKTVLGQQPRDVPVQVLELGPGAGRALGDMSKITREAGKDVAFDMIGLTPLAPRFRLNATAEEMLDFAREHGEELENGKMTIGLALRLQKKYGKEFFQILNKPFVRTQYIGDLFIAVKELKGKKYNFIYDDMGAFFYSSVLKKSQAFVRVLELLDPENGIFFPHGINVEEALGCVPEEFIIISWSRGLKFCIAHKNSIYAQKLKDNEQVRIDGQVYAFDYTPAGDFNVMLDALNSPLQSALEKLASGQNISGSFIVSDVSEQEIGELRERINAEIRGMNIALRFKKDGTPIDPIKGEAFVKGWPNFADVLATHMRHKNTVFNSGVLDIELSRYIQKNLPQDKEICKKFLVLSATISIFRKYKPLLMLLGQLDAINILQAGLKDRDNFLRTIPGNLNPDVGANAKTFYDLGAGTNPIYFLLKLSKDRHYVFVDKNPFVTAFLRQAIKMLGVSDRATVEERDVLDTKWNLEKDSCGTVWIGNSGYSLGFLPSDAWVQMIKDAMVNGGKIIIEYPEKGYYGIGEKKDIPLVTKFKNTLKTGWLYEWGHFEGDKFIANKSGLEAKIQATAHVFTKLASNGEISFNEECLNNKYGKDFIKVAGSTGAPGIYYISVNRRNLGESVENDGITGQQTEIYARYHLTDVEGVSPEEWDKIQAICVDGMEFVEKGNAIGFKHGADTLLALKSIERAIAGQDNPIVAFVFGALPAAVPLRLAHAKNVQKVVVIEDNHDSRELLKWSIEHNIELKGKIEIISDSFEHFIAEKGKTAFEKKEGNEILLVADLPSKSKDTIKAGKATKSLDDLVKSLGVVCSDGKLSFTIVLTGLYEPLEEIQDAREFYDRLFASYNVEKELTTLSDVLPIHIPPDDMLLLDLVYVGAIVRSKLASNATVSSREQINALLGKLGTTEVTDIDTVRTPARAELLYTIIAEKGDPLTIEEHRLLFDYLWERSGIGLEFPKSLKDKILSKRQDARINVIAMGYIEGLGFQLMKQNIGLTAEEERFLWQIFHRNSPSASNRPYPPALKGVIDQRHEQPVRILDIGCGPSGAALRDLKREYGERIDATGIDLEIRSGSGNGVTLVEGDIRKMPFTDGSFDIIYEQYVLPYFEKDDQIDKEFLGAMQEIMRVLKPNGMFVLNFEWYKDRHIKELIGALADIGFSTATVEQIPSAVVITKSAAQRDKLASNEGFFPNPLEVETLLKGLLKSKDDDPIHEHDIGNLYNGVRANMISSIHRGYGLSEQDPLVVDDSLEAFIASRLLGPALRKLAVTADIAIAEINKQRDFTMKAMEEGNLSKVFDDRYQWNWIIKAPITIAQLKALINRNEECGFSMLRGEERELYIMLSLGVGFESARLRLADYAETIGLSKSANSYYVPIYTDQAFKTRFIVKLNKDTLHLALQQEGSSVFRDVEQEKIATALEKLGIVQKEGLGKKLASNESLFPDSSEVAMLLGELLKSNDYDPLAGREIKRMFNDILTRIRSDMKDYDLSGEKAIAMINRLDAVVAKKLLGRALRKLAVTADTAIAQINKQRNWIIKAPITMVQLKALINRNEKSEFLILKGKKEELYIELSLGTGLNPARLCLADYAEAAFTVKLNRGALQLALQPKGNSELSNVKQQEVVAKLEEFGILEKETNPQALASNQSVIPSKDDRALLERAKDKIIAGFSKLIGAKVYNVKWVKVKAVKGDSQGEAEIKILDEDNPKLDEKASTKILITKRVKYVGNVYWAKYAESNNAERNFVLPQADIFNYLKPLKIQGIPEAEHFVELENGRKAILFKEMPQGEPLENKLLQGKCLPEKDAFDIMLKVSRIVQSLHEAGVYYWDIKPLNIWITSDNDVMLFDFDLAFRDEKDFIKHKRYKQSTPIYQSKTRWEWEQVGFDSWSFEEFLPAREEVYSLAMTLHDLLVNRPVSMEDERHPRLYADENLRLLKHEDGVSPGIKEILNKALTHGTSEYATVAEFIQVLEKCRSENVVTLASNHSALQVGANTPDFIKVFLQSYSIEERPLPAVHFDSEEFSRGLFRDKKSYRDIVRQVGDIVYIAADIFSKQAIRHPQNVVLVPIDDVYPNIEIPLQSTDGVIVAMQKLRDMINGRVFIDDGAGNGIFGILALRLGAKKVIFVEQLESLHEIIKQNARVNNVNNCKVEIRSSIKDVSNVDIEHAFVAMNISRNFSPNAAHALLTKGTPDVVIDSGGVIEDWEKYGAKPFNAESWNQERIYLESGDSLGVNGLKEVYSTPYVTVINVNRNNIKNTTDSHFAVKLRLQVSNPSLRSL